MQQNGKLETVNGNHRRQAGELLKVSDEERYHAFKFTATVYVNLTETETWCLASKSVTNESKSMPLSLPARLKVLRNVRYYCVYLSDMMIWLAVLYMQFLRTFAEVVGMVSLVESRCANY